MIARYNNISLAAGVPGLIIQVGGKMTGHPLVMVVGSILFLVGLAYYAKAKGRSAWWCLMGFLSIIGFIVLALLSDLEKTPSSRYGSVKRRTGGIGKGDGVPPGPSPYSVKPAAR